MIPDIHVLTGVVREGDLRVLGLLEVPVDQRIQVHAVQAIAPLGDFPVPFGGCRGQFLPKGGDARLQGSHQLVVNELGQMQFRFLADADEGEELRLVDRRLKLTPPQNNTPMPFR